MSSKNATPKRLSNQSNTLFNYFTSPKVNKIQPKSREVSLPRQDTKSQSDSEDEVIKFKSKKRNRIIVESDSEGENGSPNKPIIKVTKKQKLQSDSESDDDSKKRKKPKTSLQNFKAEKSIKGETSSNKESIVDKESNSPTNSQNVQSQSQPSSIHTNWLHNRLEFLHPDKIRDANKRRPDDPDYDSKTLYVPDKYLDSLTPAMRQWWIIKRSHMDCVLFFKVGKFYELYHMDAVVGVKYLGFSYMKGEFAHSGFPETAYAKMAGMLLELGFKVARIEQTETPEMMNDRLSQRKSTKFEKVVKREVCQISTKATCLYTAQMPDSKNTPACFFYALTEKKLSAGNIRFGVCCVDTAIGHFRLSEFNDDKHCSRLLAMLTENSPGLILLERGKTTAVTELLNKYFNEVPKDILPSENGFCSAKSTLEKLSTGCYFLDKDDNFTWPSFFSQVAEDCIPKPEFEMTLKCLGACLLYLKDSQIDVQVISMGKFELYEPLDINSKSNTSARDYMVLDSVTINNLNLLGSRGTLQKTLDHCDTLFGKRLLQQWICRPLCNVNKILERQKAIEELYNNPALLKAAKDVLKQLPNLEHQLAKIHCYGNKYCAQNHPDSRAVLYEEKTYSKRKIMDLIKTIKGFDNSQNIPKIFKACESHLLRKITQFQPDGMLVDLTDTLDFFEHAFDQNQAEKEGKILPKVGVDEEYDAVEERIANIKKDLDEYLEEQRKFFGCKVAYFGNDKKRFQLEIPENRANRVTSDYRLEGSKKGSKRYTTSETREMLHQMIQAETERVKIVKDLNRRIFEKFSQKREEWEQVLYCLTILDVLCSLAEYARTYSQDICLPAILPFKNEPKINVTDGRHPCVLNVENFVPNDTKMGIDDHASILLLTGPNMGGKSTLMRQVALISVMAQMGGYVPASTCELNLVDRIFTRLGANDDIIGGQSTFFVELSEASAILNHATSNSLVLLDELGRGTSTHDGNAIATAYMRKLTEIKCRTIFSTHYHSLVNHFIGHKDVQLGHMACMVENDEGPTQESVTFLYKLAEGRCPKSFGFNAAYLAGLPHKIISCGRQIAKDLDIVTQNRQLFIELFSCHNMNDVRLLIEELNTLKV